METLRRLGLYTNLMIIPATLQTYYPTGKRLGPDGSDVIGVAVDTVTLTNTASFFSQLQSGGLDPAKGALGALILGIHILTAGAGSTIAIQSHAGSVLLPAFDASAAKSILLGPDGFPITGGFRVVTAAGTAPLVVVAWEPIQFKTSTQIN